MNFLGIFKGFLDSKTHKYFTNLKKSRQINKKILYIYISFLGFNTQNYHKKVKKNTNKHVKNLWNF
jgi:D-alanyl-lipoteichoic acid acyltransferase DltB (MBOAT superfamily)